VESLSTDIAGIILHNAEVILNGVFRVHIEALVLMTPGALDCNPVIYPLVTRRRASISANIENPSCMRQSGHQTNQTSAHNYHQRRRQDVSC